MTGDRGSGLAGGMLRLVLAIGLLASAWAGTAAEGGGASDVGRAVAETAPAPSPAGGARSAGAPPPSGTRSDDEAPPPTRGGEPALPDPDQRVPDPDEVDHAPRVPDPDRLPRAPAPAEHPAGGSKP